MTRISTPTLSLTLAALIALAAAGCDRIWPAAGENGGKDVAKTVGKDAGRDAVTPQTVAAAPAAPASAPTTMQAAPAPLPPPAPLQRMTGAQEADFNAWVARTYLNCWKQPAQPNDSDPYIARVRLAFKPDGSLARAPRLVNPPSDPALKPQAKSVIQAVQACNPLPVPAQYRPFYEQWKTKTIHFNPQIAAR